MTTVFADTSYYLGLLNPDDQHHPAARSFTAGFGGRFVTTSWVLVEVGNFLRRGPNRALFVEFVRELRADERVTIAGPDGALFDAGLELFARRPDKEWSLTDCISFVVMQDEDLTDALTADHHFEQAGYTVLLK